MLVTLLALISLGAAVVYSCAAGFVLWKFAGVFVLCLALLSGAPILFSYLCSLFTDNSKPLQKKNRICLLGSRFVGTLAGEYLGLKVHLSGEEKLPEERFLLVCNHRSGLDPLVMLWKLGKYNISFISKPSNMRLPILGRIAYAAGFLPIDRENDRKALKTILTAADYIKKDVCSVGIFPEGTRSRTGELLEFHAGSFKIAQKAEAPLVIACVRGTEHALKRLPRRTDVYFDILEVLPASAVRERATAELAEYSRTLISNHLKET